MTSDLFVYARKRAPETKTIVVNLWGGPGAGKSTTAAAIFADLKMRGLNVELVTEYAKRWAWRDIKLGPFDEIYFLGKQTHSEAILYGKVQVVVTDSPILLCAYYEEHYQPEWQLVKPAAFRFVEKTAEHGIVHRNFWLVRQKPYNGSGRYQSEEQAKAIDGDLDSWLVKNQVPFEDIRVADEKRAKLIADLVAADIR